MQFGQVSATDMWVIIVIWKCSDNYAIHLLPVLEQAENILNTALAPLIKINAALLSQLTTNTCLHEVLLNKSVDMTLRSNAL